jgi:hypothetical protein
MKLETLMDIFMLSEKQQKIRNQEKIEQEFIGIVLVLIVEDRMLLYLETIFEMEILKVVVVLPV